MITFTVPVAPSSNNAYANRRIGSIGYGRVKTAKHRAWIRQADAWYLYQRLSRFKKIEGPYKCRMVFPEHLHSDLDGRAKLILDWMVKRGLTVDDKHLRKLELEHDNLFSRSVYGGQALVFVEVAGVNESKQSQDREPRPASA